MTYSFKRINSILLLFFLILNTMALVINFDSALAEDAEGFTTDLLRGLGFKVTNSTASQTVTIPKLDNESLSNFVPPSYSLSFPSLVQPKIITSFSLPSWGGLGFGFRKNITIDYSKVTEDLTDFPLLLDLSDAFDIFGVTQSTGNDIIFTDSSGTILDHELELFDTETSHLVAWVRIPNLSSTSVTLLSMYYGNETISNQQNPSGVWDSDYMAVYHLNDDPSSTIYDSTSNNNDGSSFGTVTQEEGPMGNAYYFDQKGGTNDYLRIPQSSSLSLTGNQMTLEGWMYLQFTPVPYDSMIFDKAGDNYGTQGWMMGVDGGYTSGGAGYPTRLNQRINTQNDLNVRGDSGAIYPGKWTYVSVVYDGTASSYTGYIDASNVYNNPSISGNIINMNMDLYIGRRDEAASRMFYGSMDELRISDVARSTGYMATCFNNYNDPDSFYSITTQEPGISLFEKQRTISIDSSIVSGSSDLYDFPLLLDLYLENTSQNILFKDGVSGAILDHEIELYDQTNDHLVVWVKIPILSSTFDTEIVMYTDPSIEVISSNPAIWTDYMGVWHLGETVDDETTTNNVHSDSTGINDGDQHGNNENQSIIGNSQIFDGSNDFIDMDDALDIMDPEDGAPSENYYTISGWFYRNTTSTRDTIVEKADNYVSGGDENLITGYTLYIDNTDGYLHFISGDNDDDGAQMWSGSNFNSLPTGWY
ncbi:MAG: DUF2341 domain-containing protein, partial [Candidatus Kariarchaeaceae archaeon]